jgi:hypothetical protein
VQLAQWFGWTLEQCDRLTAKDVRDILAVVNAQMKYDKKLNWWMR